MKKYFLILITLLLASRINNAQFNAAAIKEYKKVFTTYPFSDPNPIPVIGNIYPYFRYDGYTDKPIDKEWKVVELENDFIKLMITPEIGGKIWSAVEKSTGKEFIYFNHVVKFRDIAMRGPWTSGGIEPNYGIIGHTPNCATPVDYLTRVNDDGSVSCIIGVLDLLTRTNWRIEINLQKDKAYFTTKSFWYNSTPFEQPYYTWMNTGLKAKSNLEFIYPGTNYLGHGGEYASWPINSSNGKNISFYEQNNFGGYKSYHVFGKYTNFFGAFWHDENFGMGRYSTHDDKPGKKIWIWGLSPQGMIWEKLLTDSDGQYVEVQSGRLFNQTAEQSTFTPFKHRGFAPSESEVWTEYWFPVKQTRGFVKANDYGAINLKYEDGFVKIYFSPLQKIQDKIEIYCAGKSIYEKLIDLNPLQIFSDSLKIEIDPDNLTILLGGNKLVYNSDPENEKLNRPIETPDNIDWNSVNGLYLQGKELIRSRNYARAEDKLKSCLEKDPNYTPALNEMSMLMYRKMNFVSALYYSKKSLSIDSYDPAANYYYGLANLQTGKITDAKDGFDIASQSIEYRSASYVMLSKIYFRENDFQKSAYYADKSLDFNRYNLDGYQLKAVIARSKKNSEETKKELTRILEFDPLNHFAGYENYLQQKSETAKESFLSTIKNEMPVETFLELAIWYYSIGSINECRGVLELAPQNPEVNYWIAFTEKNPVLQLELINRANTLSPSLLFPFRSESAEILKWVCSKTDSWLPRYYLGLIYWDRNEIDVAKKIFDECGNKSDYAPFYAARAELNKYPAEKFISDLNTAMKLQPNEWRYGKIITNYFISQKMFKESFNAAQQFYKEFPDNYILGMTYAKTLLLNKNYVECLKILNRINVLPYEGSVDGRLLYKEACLMLAIDALKINNFRDALKYISTAKEWPEHLGAGKPYQEDIDERLEEWLEFNCYEKMKNKSEAVRALNKIMAQPKNVFGSNTLITALAFKQIHENSKGENILKDWLKKEPQNEIAKWESEVFKGNYSAPKSELMNDENLRVLSEFISTK